MKFHHYIEEKAEKNTVVRGKRAGLPLQPQGTLGFPAQGAARCSHRSTRHPTTTSERTFFGAKLVQSKDIQTRVALSVWPPPTLGWFPISHLCLSTSPPGSSLGCTAGPQGRERAAWLPEGTLVTDTSGTASPQSRERKDTGWCLQQMEGGRMVSPGWAVSSNFFLCWGCAGGGAGAAVGRAVLGLLVGRPSHMNPTRSSTLTRLCAHEEFLIGRERNCCFF